jgi:hypothetical protein
MAKTGKRRFGRCGIFGLSCCRSIKYTKKYFENIIFAEKIHRVKKV